MQTIKLPSLAKCSANDAYLVVDLPGLAKAARESSTMPNAIKCNLRGQWYGGRFNFEESCQALITGDLAGVADSDALLASIESTMPDAFSNSWQTFDSLSGGLPNVQNYISGNPMNMRLRRRVRSEQAPLAIFADTTLSAQISTKDMRKRGAAILALVRLLSNRRPIELYAVVGAGNAQTAAYIMARIETAPLDLARAAHVLTEPSVTRGIGSALVDKLHNDGTLGNGGWQGEWAYGSNSLYRQHAQASMQRVAATGSDAIYIPAAHTHDAAIAKPVKWLGTMLRQYGGEAFNSDAA